MAARRGMSYDMAARARHSLVAVPLLAEGDRQHMLLEPSQSLAGVLETLIRRGGPCDVLVVSFAVAVAAAARVAQVARSLTLLVGATAMKRGPQAYTDVAALPRVRVVEAATHMKVSVMRGDAWGCVVSGSAHLTRPEGTEWLDITWSASYADAVWAQIWGRHGQSDDTDPARPASRRGPEPGRGG